MRHLLRKNYPNLISLYILLSLFAYFFFLRLTEYIPLFLAFVPLTIWLSQKPWTLFKNSKALVLLVAFGLEMILSLVFNVIHHSADFYFLLFWGLRFLFLCFWLLTLRASSYLEETEKLLEALTVIFILHACITWLMYFFPGFRNAILGTQFLTDMAKASYVANSYGQRLISVGIMFFGGGAFYGCMTCLLLIYASENAKQWWPWLAVITLSLTGVLIARTALIGILVGLIFLLHQNFKKNILRALGLILALSLGMLGLWANPKTGLLVQNAMDPFAFRPILKRINSLVTAVAPLPVEKPTPTMPTEPSSNIGLNSETALISPSTTTTTSTTTTQPTLTLPPPVIDTSILETIVDGSKAIAATDLKTWLIGTGKVFSKTGYYGGTDIAYLRLSYYGGILYCLAYFAPVALCFFYYFRNPNISRLQYKLLLALFILQLIFNLKGIIDLSVFYIAFFMSKNHSSSIKPENT